MARSGSMPAAAREADERRARRGRVPGGRCVRECWARGGGARGRTHGKLHVIIVRRRQVVELRHGSPRLLVQLVHAAQHRLVLEHGSDGLHTHAGQARVNTDGLAAQPCHQSLAQTLRCVWQGTVRARRACMGEMPKRLISMKSG